MADHRRTSYDLPAYHWQLEALAFLDHLLFGADNGYAAQKRVRCWTHGAGTNGEADDWPLPKSMHRLYLRSCGSDSAANGLTPDPPQGGANRWAAVPYGATIPGGFDEIAHQRLTFETLVDEAMELTGPVTVSLCFSSNEINSHVVARTGVVADAGDYQILSIGAIRPACRKIDQARSTATEIAIDIDTPEPLVPGVPVTRRFSLTSQPVLLQPGQRFRLDIASRADILRSGVSHGHAQFDMQVPPYFARNKIPCGPQSFIEVRRVAEAGHLWLPADEACGHTN